MAALFVAACGGDDSSSTASGGSNNGGTAGASSNPNGGATALNGGAANGGTQAGAGTSGELSGDAGVTSSSGDTGNYEGPTAGRAQTFAALAYSAITAANISTLSGDIGVSAGAQSNITGFSAAGDKKYGTDSLAPNSMRTILAQEDVTALVGNIDPRACDTDLTNVVGGLTGDITLHPGVTCMNSFSADVLLNGHVTLDAGGDSNAFFIIRGNLTLTVADAAQVVLANGAEACGVFWRFSKQVTIGKTVKFYGTVIAGTAITMSTGSTLTGRALAQTAGVMLDANSITIPTDGLIGSAGVCTHEQ
jgi:Ice-binding-like